MPSTPPIPPPILNFDKDPRHKFNDLQLLYVYLIVYLLFSQLKNAMYGKHTSVDDPLLQRVWTHSSNPAKNLLLSLGFNQVTTEGNQKLLQLKWDSEHVSIEDAYVAVFVLCTK